MREVVTTALDVLGLLLVAAGVTGGLWALAGPVSLVAGGVVVLAGRTAADHLTDRAARRAIRRATGQDGERR